MPRHLSETVQANGSRWFARFNLWLQEEMQSIVVDGDGEGLVRILQGNGSPERDLDDLKELVDILDGWFIGEADTN